MPGCLFFRKKVLKIMLLNSGEKVNSKSLLLTVSRIIMTIYMLLMFKFDAHLKSQVSL